MFCRAENEPEPEIYICVLILRSVLTLIMKATRETETLWSWRARRDETSSIIDGAKIEVEE